MNLALGISPSGAGLVLATAAVIGGARLFSAGLHASRLRRQLVRVRPTAFPDAPDGDFAQLSGAVALESPMFGPISGVPCAGYDLDVRGVGAPVRCIVSERRPFRLEGEDGSVEVPDAIGSWEVGITADREIGADEGISTRLAALLARAPETLWWRRAGGRLHITERALRAGATCHVVGRVHVAHSIPVEGAAETLRTGTDDAIAWAPGIAEGAQLVVGAGDHLGWMLVSDREPSPERLRVPGLHTLGLVVGPLLGLLGILYLASAADTVRTLGRF